jgi:hypothetical protein
MNRTRNRNDDANSTNSTLSVLTGGVTLSSVTAAALATRPERKNPFGHPGSIADNNQRPAKQTYSSFAESVIAQNKNVRRVTTAESVIARNRNRTPGNSKDSNNYTNRSNSKSSSGTSNYNHQAKMNRIAAKYRRSNSPEKRLDRKPKLSPSKQMDSKKRSSATKPKRSSLQNYLKEDAAAVTALGGAGGEEVETSPKESLRKWKPNNDNDDDNYRGSPSKVSPKKLTVTSRILSDSEEEESNDCEPESGTNNLNEETSSAVSESNCDSNIYSNTVNTAGNTSTVTSEEPPLENLLQQASTLLKKAGKVGLERRRRSIGRLSLGGKVGGSGRVGESGNRLIQTDKHKGNVNDNNDNMTVEGSESRGENENGTTAGSGSSGHHPTVLDNLLDAKREGRLSLGEEGSGSQESSPQEEASQSATSPLDSTWTDTKIRIWSDVRKW